MKPPHAPSRLLAAAAVLALSASGCGDDASTSTGDEASSSATEGSGGTDGSSGTDASSGSPSSGSAQPNTGSSSGGGSAGEGGASASTGSSGEGGSGSGSGAGGGGPDPVCVPDTSGAQSVPASCGIFVDPNLPENVVGSGTRDDPYRSINHALGEASEAGVHRMYVREGATNDLLELGINGFELYGGLTAQWTYDEAARTYVAAPADAYIYGTVHIGANEGETLIDGFDIVAGGGPSSMALFVSETTVRLRRVSLQAIDGWKFQDRSAITDPAPTNPEADGEAFLEANGVMPSRGGWGGYNTACLSSSASGGDGGEGAEAADVYAAADGTIGSPDMAGGPGGQGAADDGLEAMDCTPGEDGDDGAPGPPAEEPFHYFYMSAYLGMVTPLGPDGGDGPSGRGGGGGGGGKPTLNGKTLVAGDGGNGGGAGGCGGRGGEGGDYGGSSYGLVAFESTVIFEEDVSVAAADGGPGSNGAPGQPGSDGGTGVCGVAPDTWTACCGGNGGRGGRGGAGGGGPGGHSFAIARTTSSEIIGDAVLSYGVGGPGGLAGDDVAPDGLAGFTGDVLVVDETGP